MITSRIENQEKTTSKRTRTGTTCPATKRRRRSNPTPPATKSTARPHDPLWNTFTLQHRRVHTVVPGVPMGSGSMKDPYRIPLRDKANATGCVHCPLGVETCDCRAIEAIISKHLQHVYATTKLRRTHAYGRSPLNSKSVLPVFVSRLARICTVKADDVVWDLGCGIGSVVMQFALQTGASAVGVDIQGANIRIARKTWARVRKEWIEKYPKKPVGDIQFIENDIFAALARHVGPPNETPTDKTDRAHASPTVVWAANLLFTPSMNTQLASMLHRIQPLRSVASMVDIYPHNRSGAFKKRDPEPYTKFPVMEDHISQADCYEWTETEKRPFYTYQTKNSAQPRSSTGAS